MTGTRLVCSLMLACASTLSFAPAGGLGSESVPKVLVVAASAGAQPGIGTVLGAGDCLHLVNGQRMRLLASTGAISDVVGPFRGTTPRMPGARSAAQAGFSERLFDAIEQFLQILAVRSDPRSDPLDPAILDLSASGHHCAPADRKLTAWRPAWPKRSSVLIRRTSDGQHKRMWWDKGSTSNTWPFAVPPSGEDTFEVSSDLPKILSKITLVSLEALPADPLAAAAKYAERDCLAQAHREVLRADPDSIATSAKQ